MNCRRRSCLKPAAGALSCRCRCRFEQYHESIPLASTLKAVARMRSVVHTYYKQATQVGLELRNFNTRSTAAVCDHHLQLRPVSPLIWLPKHRAELSKLLASCVQGCTAIWRGFCGPAVCCAGRFCPAFGRGSHVRTGSTPRGVGCSRSNERMVAPTAEPDAGVCLAGDYASALKIQTS